MTIVDQSPLFHPFIAAHHPASGHADNCASVATESLPSSSPGVLTPQSSTIFSPERDNKDVRHPGPADSDLAVPAGDEPISTIESDSDDASTRITRPSNGAKGKGKDKESVQGPHGTEEIDDGIGNMSISSPEFGMGMGDMAAAIDGIASSSRSVAAQADSRRLEPERDTPHRRRRSSSRMESPVHDVQDEEPPQDKFHEAVFQRAYNGARGIVSQLANVLASNSLHIDPDSTLQRLHNEAQNLAGFQCPAIRTVGLVGDSGVGKSSLINSLLDQPALARASNNGAACTCVVTEYHYRDSDMFDIEMEVFEIEDIMSQLANHMRSYRNYHLNHRTMDASEREELKEKARRAQDTIQAMFQGLIENQREEFLTDAPENTVLRTFRSWVEERRPAPVGQRGIGLTLGGCSDLLSQLSSDQASTHQAATWPYVKKIKVWLKAHILSKGLVLVDLPGLRDLNSARQRITERHLIACHEIFAICRIGRAATDVGVEAVFELARQAKLSNVGIICTRSDDIEVEEAKKDWKGAKARHIQRFLDAVERDRQELDKLEEELEDCTHTDSEGGQEHEVQLHRRIRIIKKRMNDHKFDLKEYIIKTRNNDVVERLAALYGNRVPGLRVFCISNSDYWQHRKSAVQFLHLSGIISLRKHCISMVAESQFRAATKYIKDSIPTLLSDLALWVESGSGSVSLERKKLVCDTLGTIEGRIRSDLTGAMSEIKGVSQSMRREFQERIFQRRLIGDWTRSASRAAQSWSTWHHCRRLGSSNRHLLQANNAVATYSAFCRNYGHHSTNAVGLHNWNEEAIERMTLDTSAQWSGLRPIIQHKNDTVVVLIESTINWAIQYLDTELQEDTLDLTVTLCDSLRSRQNLITSELEDIRGVFEANLSTLQIDALSGIRTSFIGTALEDAYDACNHEGGTGSDARRKSNINRRLGDQRVFEGIAEKFRSGFSDLSTGLQNDIDDAIETHLNDIRRTLDIIRTDNAITESEQDPTFRDYVAAETIRARDRIRQLQAVIPN